MATRGLSAKKQRQHKKKRRDLVYVASLYVRYEHAKAMQREWKSVTRATAMASERPTARAVFIIAPTMKI
jgi:hypothetical protein